MIINNAGSLRKEYFIAYMKLLMNAFECSIEVAKERTFAKLFQLNKDNMGEETYTQFLLAYQELKNMRKDA